MGPEAADSRQPRPQFSHTHNSVYLVGFFAVACIFYDSTQVRFIVDGFVNLQEVTECLRWVESFKITISIYVTDLKVSTRSFLVEHPILCGYSR
jgi:hypothetical protein